MRADLPQRLGALVLRLGSIAAGALIIKHEVYDTSSAEIVVIALGLWLIGVPPALWLDALRRASKTLDLNSPEDSPRREVGTHPHDGDDGPS